MKVIKRKWEWIAEHCGYPDARAKALKIDDALLELYGDKNTECWVRFCEENPNVITNPTQEEILNVMMNDDFCIACEESIKKSDGESACNKCVFGEKYGRCNQNGSLFDEFRNEYELTLLEDNGRWF